MTFNVPTGPATTSTVVTPRRLASLSSLPVREIQIAAAFGVFEQHGWCIDLLFTLVQSGRIFFVGPRIEAPLSEARNGS
jgi:hypothetical protein